MRTSRVFQWLGILLPVSGTQVRSLLREDPPCLEKLGPRGDDCAAAPPACAPHRKPPPPTAARDCPRAATKAQHSQSKSVSFLKLPRIYPDRAPPLLYSLALRSCPSVPDLLTTRFLLHEGTFSSCFSFRSISNVTFFSAKFVHNCVSHFVLLILGSSKVSKKHMFLVRLEIQ